MKPAPDPAAGSYPGTKGHLYRWTIARFAPHAVYVEPFAGAATIARHKPPAARSLLIDQNPRAVRWLRSLRLPATTVRRACGIQYLEREARDLGPEALVYVDPPYRHAHRHNRHLYGPHELTDGHHARLLHAVRRLSARVAVAHYPDPLYDRALANWHRETASDYTRGGPRDTALWTNYRPDDLGQIPAPYVGRNARDRTRIARKAARWRAMFRELPPGEQAALLAAVLNEAHAAADLPEPFAQPRPPKHR